MPYTAIALLGVFSSVGIGFWMIYLVNKEMTNNFRKYNHKKIR